MADVDRKLMMETRAAQQLRDELRTITDDAQTISDTVEGETNLKDTIHAALKAMDEEAMLLNGMKQYQQVIAERRERMEWRQEKRRAAMQKAMEAGELTKLIFPEATISLKAVAPGLDITDEKLIPAQYFVPQEPRLDKNLLKETLKSGKTVLGATMDNGGQTISIRRG